MDNNKPNIPVNPGCDCRKGQQSPSDTSPSENKKPTNCYCNVGYAYVPVQTFNNIYSPSDALCRGTLFPELDMPFGVYGAEVG